MHSDENEMMPMEYDKLTAEDSKKYILECFVKIREQYLLPVVVQKEISMYLEMILSTFAKDIKNRLSAAGFHHAQEVLPCESEIQSMIEHLNSKYLFDKQLRQYFSFIPPREKSVRLQAGEVKFQYIFIIELLQVLLRKEHILDYVLGRVSTSNELVMRHPTHGSSFQGSFFDVNYPAVQLILYIDDFEVVNPIGSRRSIHKLCAIYVTIGNLPLSYNSHLENIHLLCLFKAHDVTHNKGDFSPFLEPLLTELKVLESEGILVGELHVKAGLMAVTGDNLSSHSLGGFSRNFNHGRICRWCMAVRSEIGDFKREKMLRLRNMETHQYHLKAALVNTSLGLVYGVKSACPFSILQSFQVLEGFPPDIMHDCLEGIVPLTMKLVLKHLIRDKHVTLQKVNAELKLLSWGNDNQYKVQLSDSATKSRISISWLCHRKMGFVPLSTCSLV